MSFRSAPCRDAVTLPTINSGLVNTKMLRERTLGLAPAFARALDSSARNHGQDYAQRIVVSQRPLHSAAMQYAYMGDVAERLKQARERAGYGTATAAAEAMGIREPTYLAHENGSRGVKPGPGKKYAKKFKVNFDWLMNGTGPMSGSRSEFEEKMERLPEEDRLEIQKFIDAKLTIRGLI